jgi:peptide chain release factor 3
LGAVGVLQFEVTMARLKNEYSVDAVYEPINFSVARWLYSENSKILEEFKKKNPANIAVDAENCLTFLTTSEWQLGYAVEQWPDITFQKTRELL